jgi:hypothetical protein
LTLTAIVELDVAVDVEPIVDLHLDHRSRFFDEDSETRRSTYKVKVEEGVDVYVAVQVDVLRQRQGRRQRPPKDVPGLHRHPGISIVPAVVAGFST